MAGLFDKPSSDWSLQELEVGAAVVAAAVQEARINHDPTCAAAFSTLAVVLAEERDRRRALHDEIADILTAALVTDVGPV